MQDIGQAIRALRLARGWGQKELAARSRVPARDISIIESGALARYIQRLLDALGWTPEIGANLEALRATDGAPGDASDQLPTCPHCGVGLGWEALRDPDEHGRATADGRCAICGGAWRFFRSPALPRWTLGIARRPTAKEVAP